MSIEPATMRWQTPPEVFRPLHEELFFDFDAAASDRNALRSSFISRHEDCLSIDWQAFGRRAWFNPPFGRKGNGFPGGGAFVARAWQMSRKMEVVCLLTEANTDTTWWWEWMPRADEIRLTTRIRFLRPDGTVGPAPKSGHAITIFRPHVPEAGWPGGPRISYWDPYNKRTA